MYMNVLKLVYLLVMKICYYMFLLLRRCKYFKLVLLVNYYEVLLYYQDSLLLSFLSWYMLFNIIYNINVQCWI